ncbi:VOC family protein [Synechococcus sp. A10-1-5-1]|uniref:VOC family protein n=1 Tax=Synechococcus sp. A10-1-5-1 TaxID=2936507 RepID=UPI002000F047|nr:VOC family protein [Synechococcus sp. A10-1-5-1]UPM50101.1 VOC family protein [Synechococcus sp. A10-1-5-1]
MSTLPQVANVGFSCSDAETLAHFYEQHLGCRRVESVEIHGGPYAELIGLAGSRLRLHRLQLGEEQLELTEVLKLGPELRPGRPIPQDSRSCDLWFQHICVVVADMAQAAAPISAKVQAGVLQAISKAPQTLPAWNQAAAGIQAYKFHDPEGHCLELLQFPKGKGDARWHPDHPGRTFLGIDHSAIANANTDRSAAFYGELLGLRFGGDGVNHGLEQDQLDGLEGTQVHISAHRCPRGAGIECLNYIEPTGGRPIPADQSAADIAHWQIRLQVSDLNSISQGLEAFGGSLVSGGIHTLSSDQASVLGFRRGLQVRDPDGHQLQLVSTD